MPSKSFIDYIEPPPHWWTSSFDTYNEKPATALLTELVHISDAMNQCLRHFPGKRKKTEEFNKNSQDSIYRLGGATLASMMGHFETFERFLFGRVFEFTQLIPGFPISGTIKKLEKEASLTIDISLMARYRGQPTSVGQILADSLGGWHDPEKVNSLFKSIVPDLNFYSNQDIDDLTALWQLRHSIVHTAGWLTRPDSQKIKSLNPFGGRALILGDLFVVTVARKLHPLVRDSVGRLRNKFLQLLPGDLDADSRESCNRLFEVESPRASWLK